jgi:hypothetical protein
MQNHYTQMRKFAKRIDSIVDLQRNKKSAPRSTKGLLARQKPAMEEVQPGQEDYTKRIANYVNNIRAKRLSLQKEKNEPITE